MPFVLRTPVGPRNRALNGVYIPHVKGQFCGKGAPIVKYRDCLPWAVQNGWTDRNAVWVVGLCGPKEPYIRWGFRSPCKGQFLGERTCPTALCGELCKMAQPIEIPFWLWTRVGRRKHVLHGDTLAPPSECNWTVHVRWRCGLYVKLLWPLVIIRLHRSTLYVDAAYCYRQIFYIEAVSCMSHRFTGFSEKKSTARLKVKTSSQS